MKKRIVIGYGKRISLEDVGAVADGAVVAISPATKGMLQKRRLEIVEYVEKKRLPAYGFNRGFGHNVDTPVLPEDAANLQRNLIISHACGVGEPLSVEVVRAAMLLRAHALCKGHSGARYEVVKLIVDFLNRQITPVVPSYGSVGASGDLAPLSHIALALIGEGEVFFGNSAKRLRARQALRAAKLTPLVLQMKEGLALNNGAQVSTALAITAHLQMVRLIRTAAVASALSAQVLLGSDAPFSAPLHELRPHPGAKIVAKWIFQLMQRSPIRNSHRDPQWDGEVQDPYSLRCTPQILGSCYDLLQASEQILLTEANSATDNPLLLPDNRNRGKHTLVVSGGHFHGMPIAIALYNYLQAMGIIARLSNMRAARFVDEKRNDGLGKDLIWPQLSIRERSTSSGMMIPEYVSAALTNVIWGAAMPSHLFSLSTDAGQEDHVSMSAGLGKRVLDTIPRLAEVLAIELAFASQAAAIRVVSESFPGANGKPVKWPKSARKLSPKCQKIVREIQQVFPIVKRDRVLSDDLMRLASLVQKGRLLKLAGL